MAGTRSSKVDGHVGRRVRERRNALGMSQEKLAAALGISFQQIQKYEKGANRVSAGRLYAMAQRLNVTPDYFFEGVELPSSKQIIPDLLGRHDNQVIALVKGFTQISDDGTCSAIAGLVGLLAESEAPQTKPRKRPKAKRKS